jgi:hypothetical protein
MSEPVTITSVFLKIIPGAIGALVSLRFLKIEGTLNKICTTLGGIASSYYATDWVAAMLSAPQGLLGFGLGLFGMAIIAKCFEVVENINAQGVAGWLQNFLPSKKGGE